MSVHEGEHDSDAPAPEETQEHSRIRDALRRLRSRRRADGDAAPADPADPNSSALDRSSVLRALHSASQHSPGVASSDGAAAQPGSAKYRLDQEIGAGGVGVVYRGVDAYLGREVALKFLNARYRDNESVVARFLEEAQIGGQLQHPGIVPVHDIGVVDGQLFFAMKMVQGRALSSLLARRESPTAERGRLLKIFEAVCQTMAYAHARHVIHRDLKPDNVMVGEFGEVQVVDWGMAKVLDGEWSAESGGEVGQTPAVETVRSAAAGGARSVAGMVMGTPDYMPPEQARGEVDVMDARADVFALGAMLLEILTGHPPDDGPSLDDRLGQARRCELDAAHGRLQRCGADAELVQLCVSCLRAEPDARPASAGVVADRISRYLTGVEQRAEAARLEAARAQIKAQAERKARRLTVGLAGAVVLIVCVVSGGWLWLSWHAESRRRDTDAQILGKLEVASTAQARGDWIDAVAAVDAAQVLAEAGDGSEALAARARRAHEGVHDAATKARAVEEFARRNRVLRRALEEVRYPESAKTRVSQFVRLADDYLAAFRSVDLDLLANSVAAAVRAAQARGIDLELAAAIEKWSYACWGAGQRDSTRRLIQIANTLDPHPDRVELRNVTFVDDPVRAEKLVQRLARMTVEDQAPVWHSAGRLLAVHAKRTGSATSRAAYLELCRRAQQREPRRFDVTFELARALYVGRSEYAREAARYLQSALSMRPDSVEVRHMYGVVLDENLGESEQAVQLFSEALDRKPDDAHLWWHLGLAYRNLGRFKDSERACRKSIALDQNDLPSRISLARTLRRMRKPTQSAEQSREVIRRDRKRGRAWAVLGQALADQGKHADAIPAYERAIEHDPESATLHNFGLALSHVGRTKDAVEAFRSALRLDANNAGARRELGFVLSELGEHERAIATYRETLRRAPQHASSWHSLGIQLSRGQKFGEALSCLRQAKRLGHPSVDTALVVVLRKRADELDKLGRYGDAADAFEEAVELDPDNAVSQHQLGQFRFYRQPKKDVIGPLERAATLAPKSGIYRYDLGNALMRVGRTEDAILVFRAAVECTPGHAESWCNLGFALGKLGRYIEALPCYEEGHRLGSKRKGWNYPSAKWVENARRLAAEQRKRGR